MIVCGAAGAGKSTLCQRLAGTVTGVVMLDADSFDDELDREVSLGRDYVTFWRSLLRVAHEISQNDLMVAYFGVVDPWQVLASQDRLAYFDQVHFLGLMCDEADLRSRLRRRRGSPEAAARAQVHIDLNHSVAEAAGTTPNMATVDASRPVVEVEKDVRAWMIRIVATSSPD